MIKAFSNSIPARYTINKIDSRTATILFYTNTEQVDSMTGQHSSEIFSLTMPIRPNFEKYIDANYDYLLDLAKKNDLDKEAAEIRNKRNLLLQESDAHVLLDRIGLEIPSGDTFAAWKPFLSELALAVSGEWATYRQALRDVPQQEGFPYSIVWPTKPAE